MTAYTLTEEECMKWVTRQANALLGVEGFVADFDHISAAWRLRIWQRRLEYVQKHGPAKITVVDAAVNPELILKPCLPNKSVLPG